MLSNYRIYPYKIGSESATALARALNGLKVFPDRKFQAKPRHRIINWGNSVTPVWLKDDTQILNKPQNVAIASNKLQTLNTLKQNHIPHVEFTQSLDVAKYWIDLGHKVYCRTQLNSHSGQGIVVARTVEELVPCDLYTKGVETRAEYRVHVFNGKVIDYIKKRRRVEDEPTQTQQDIRNHDNGWIFTRENLKRLDRVEEMAINAITTLGLDFGACDIIRDNNNQCFLLEVNTAVGLEGQTLENYKQAITEFYESR